MYKENIEKVLADGVEAKSGKNLVCYQPASQLRRHKQEDSRA